MPICFVRLNQFNCRRLFWGCRLVLLKVLQKPPFKNNSFMCSTAFTKLVSHLLCPFLKRSSWFCENKGMRGLALPLKGFYSTAYVAISRSWKCFPILSMKEKLILLIQFFFFGCCFLFSSSPSSLLLLCWRWRKMGSFYLQFYSLWKLTALSSTNKDIYQAE